MLRQKLLVVVVLKLELFLLWRSGGLPCLVRCEMGKDLGEELRCRWRLLLIPQPGGGSRQAAQLRRCVGRAYTGRRRSRVCLNWPQLDLNLFTRSRTLNAQHG